MYAEVPSKYQPVEGQQIFVQIINIHRNQWIVVSNFGCSEGTLNIYDSMYPTLSLQTKKQICSFWKSPIDQITFQMVNVQRQPNASDSGHGVFAVAVATEIVHGKDPRLSYWDVSRMRLHLIECLENRLIQCFPQARTRRIPPGNQFKKVIQETVLYLSYA